MNFATVKGWEIPEGNVTKITDASGRVLWSATPIMVRVSFPNGTYQEGGYHDGNNNYVEVSTLGVDGTWEGNDLIVPAGTELTLWARGTSDYYVMVTIYDQSYTVTEKDWSHPFTVTQDTLIELYGESAHIYAIGHFTVNGVSYDCVQGQTWKDWFKSSYNTTDYASGTITDANGNNVPLDSEIVNGGKYNVQFAESVKVTITGSGNYSKCYLTIDGQMYYRPATIKVTVGAVISCTVKHSGTTAVKEISLNGTVVSTSTYDYVVNKSITVALKYHYLNTATIDITEQ